MLHHEDKHKIESAVGIKIIFCISVCFSSLTTFQALHLTLWCKTYILQSRGHLPMTVSYATQQGRAIARTQIGSIFFLERY